MTTTRAEARRRAAAGAAGELVRPGRRQLVGQLRSMRAVDLALYCERLRAAERIRCADLADDGDTWCEE